VVSVWFEPLNPEGAGLDYKTGNWKIKKATSGGVPEGLTVGVAKHSDRRSFQGIRPCRLKAQKKDGTIRGIRRMLEQGARRIEKNENIRRWKPFLETKEKS